MTIHQEEPWRLKVTLSAKELMDYKLTFDDLDYSCPETRNVLNNLMQKASEQTNFEVNQGKLLIEVFPACAGGCTIYFTVLESSTPKARNKLRLKKSRPSRNPYIFEFGSGGDLLEAIEQLYRSQKSRNLKSSLYLLDNNYRLMVYINPNDHFTPVFTGEYASDIYQNKTVTAYTTEHGTLLEGDYAIKTVGSILVPEYSQVLS